MKTLLLILSLVTASVYANDEFNDDAREVLKAAISEAQDSSIKLLRNKAKSKKIENYINCDLVDLKKETVTKKVVKKFKASHRTDWMSGGAVPAMNEAKRKANEQGYSCGSYHSIQTIKTPLLTPWYNYKHTVTYFCSKNVQKIVSYSNAERKENICKKVIACTFDTEENERLTEDNKALIYDLLDIVKEDYECIWE